MFTHYPRRPAVVFYDCCIDQMAFGAGVREILGHGAAEEICVRERFSPRVCRNDRALLTAVGELKHEEFPKHLCLFLTQDGKDFEDRNRGNPSQWAVKVIIIRSSNGVALPRVRARRVIQGIADAMREMRSRAQNGIILTCQAFFIIDRSTQRVSAR